MKHRGACALLLTVGIAACSRGSIGQATITAMTPESNIAGTVSLTDTSQGLRIVARVTHAPPGRHGFHIHEHGSCANSGNAAGSHYNPAGVRHGYLPSAGVAAAHAGDFGNVDVGPDGRGTLTLTIPGLTLTDGEYPVIGKAIILHAHADDLTSQPTGNAGARIGCGVIQITGE